LAYSSPRGRADGTDTCAIGNDRIPWCWGNSRSSQLGLGNNEPPHLM